VCEAAVVQEAASAVHKALSLCVNVSQSDMGGQTGVLEDVHYHNRPGVRSCSSSSDLVLTKAWSPRSNAESKFQSIPWLRQCTLVLFHTSSPLHTSGLACIFLDSAECQSHCSKGAAAGPLHFSYRCPFSLVLLAVVIIAALVGPIVGAFGSTVSLPNRALRPSHMGIPPTIDSTVVVDTGRTSILVPGLLLVLLRLQPLNLEGAREFQLLLAV
jgi:hypothetical protein